MRKRLFALVVACCAVLAHAGETQDRAAIRADIRAAFESGDLASIDARYARALASKARMTSGVFVSGRMVREMGNYFPSGSNAPKGTDESWTVLEDKARAWTVKSPQSVLAAIALSQAYRAHGWAYRGGGYANSVAKEDWAKFKQYMDRAQEPLLARADLGKNDPNWHWQMLELARLQGWPNQKLHAFAESALDAFPGYYDIYFELSGGTVPQWGGSLKQLAAFAEHAVERTKAIDGRAMYARIYWSVYGYLGADSFKRGDLDWPKIRAGFDDLVKRYPDPWNLNFYARIACDAGDKTTARRVLELVGDRIDADAWANRPEYVRCKTLAAS